MKVVLINDQLNPGGAEKVLIYIANLLHKNGIDVRVVLILGEAALDVQLNMAIPIHYIKRKSKFSYKAFKNLNNLVADADIVHIHSRYNLRYYMVGKFFFNISKPKVLFHEHVPSFKIDLFTKYLMNCVDAYVAVQDSMRSWTIEKGIVHSNKSYYIPNVVDPPAETIKIDYTSKKILMVANFRPQKNHYFALQVIAKLPQEYTLDLYGMIDDPIYYADIKKQIILMNLKERVEIIHGVTNIYPKLSNYSLAIHTAKAETGPLVLIEYLHAQIPFITNNTGDVAEVIKDILPEFIIDDFDVNQWSKRILLLNQVKKPVHEDKYFSLIESKFSENTYLTKLLSVYTKVLSA